MTDTPCQIWEGATRNGYAVRSDPTRGRLLNYLHREVWKAEHGPIPVGMEIHHKCENRLCLNVKHLECLTPKQHMARHGKKPARCGTRYKYTKLKCRCDACRLANREYQREYALR